MIALLLAVALGPDRFQVAQYTASAASLRGCAECRGERDDACAVRAGVQVLPLAAYAKERWPAPGRIKLLRPSAEASCAVAADALLGPRAQVELAAIRLAGAAPAPALLEKLPLRAGVRGWPRRHALAGEVRAIPQRNALRAALVCWPSPRGWPLALPGGADARPSLDASNLCERWLLAVDSAGEPDLLGVSYPVAEPAAPFSAADWPQAFGTAEAPPPPPPAPRAPAAAGPLPCADAARERTATLDRFDQWDLQVRAASRPSLDRASLTLSAPLWSGHCQELDVLRAALEKQLACTLRVDGACLGVEAR